MIDNRRKSVDAYMPLWIGDYLADTTHLTTEQHGAYLLLLMAYWRKGGPLPADEPTLARIAKMTTHKWKAIRPVIAALFIEGDGVWRSKRADAELEKANALKAARSASGKRGAEVSNSKRTGKIVYVAPHAVNQSHEKTQGGFEVKAFEILEGGFSTKTAENSDVNHSNADDLLSAKPQPSPSPIRTRTDSSSNPENQNHTHVLSDVSKPVGFGVRPKSKKPKASLQMAIPDDEVGSIMHHWNAMAEFNGLPQVKILTPTRKQKIQARLSEFGGLEPLSRVIDAVESQPFLLGKSGRGWKADFDWLMEPSNIAKVAEMKYSNGVDRNGHH